MSNKRHAKLAVLSILGILALTSCGSAADEIKSLPSNYNDPIITIDNETEEIHNNIIKIIADQYHDGEITSKTLDKVLYRYAQSVYGAYNKVALADGDTSLTLKEATKIARSNATDEEKEKLYNFIRGHKVYWTYNEKGVHINDDDEDPEKWKPVEDDKTFIPCSSEITRMTSRYDNIEKRIAENMFNKISGSSYTTKHFFKEADYLKSLYEAGQSVIKYTDQAVKDVVPLIIDYTIEGDDVFEENILHREFYQTNYGLTEDETSDVAGVQYHYIEKEIVPQIYGDLLIEQYLLDEESNAVKQSRARLINVIKIEKYSSFHINADLLVKQLVKEIYSKAHAPSGDYYAYVDEVINPYKDIFEKYEEISKGLKVYDPATVTPVEEIDPTTGELNPAYWDADQIIYRIHASRSDAYKYKVSVQGKAYYENTAYGDLVEDYDEFLSAESFDEIDTSLRDKFTSSGTISPEEGFDQERISLSQVEAITKGWYVQKSGPTLDSNGKIKENLFQLSVANNKLEAKDATDPILQWKPANDNKGLLAATDRYTKESGEWEIRDEKSKDENKYICSVNGAYFLKFEGSYAGSDYVNDIVYDDGNAYYICQVIEAAKDVKLRNSDSASSYANTRAPGFLNDVISEVTTKVAETGSYSSLSKEYWLKKMDIKYHDQSVYDYFKSNYPDLFE